MVLRKLNLQKKNKQSTLLCRSSKYFDLKNVVLLGPNEDPRHLKRAISGFVENLFVVFGLFLLPLCLQMFFKTCYSGFLYPGVHDVC